MLRLCMCTVYRYVCGEALWALTFYNPNLGLPTRERRPVERHQAATPPQLRPSSPRLVARGPHAGRLARALSSSRSRCAPRLPTQHASRSLRRCARGGLARRAPQGAQASQDSTADACRREHAAHTREALADALPQCRDGRRARAHLGAACTTRGVGGRRCGARGARLCRAGWLALAGA